ncbi:MAG: hypothetical protein AABZ40_01885 [Thermodesulfobacteriota bacterium]
MELKEYQQGVLRRVDHYLAVLAAQMEKVEKAGYLIAEQGIDLDIGDPCRKAWDQLNKERVLPYLKDRDGRTVVAPWLPRHDGLQRSIPNICLKVPTGGGKTLLAQAELGECPAAGPSRGRSRRRAQGLFGHSKGYPLRLQSAIYPGIVRHAQHQWQASVQCSGQRARQGPQGRGDDQAADQRRQ